MDITANQTDARIDRENLAEFLDRIKSLDLRRIPIVAFKQCFYESFPDLLDHPDRNRYVLNYLDVLVSNNLIRFPSKSKRNWDNSARPSLPFWISLLQSDDEDMAVINPYDIAWVEELSFCTRLRNRAQLKAAMKINDYLIHNREALSDILPIRERSLLVFGDEKRLDSLVDNGFLFGKRLSLAALGAVAVPPPVPYEGSGERGKDILVIENHNTYWSACNWNRKTSRYSAIVWGGGNAILNNIDGLAQLAASLETRVVEYFGDVDLRGLQILHRVIERLALRQMEAWPQQAFYEWLLDNGCIVASSSTVCPSSMTPMLAHFPQQTAEQISSLLQQGKRIPQEALNSSVLARKFVDLAK